MRLLAVALAFALLPGVASGQDDKAAKKAPEYAPRVGQAGKDVIWVPTPDKVVSKMLQVAKVTQRDFVVDLGAGDGRTVIAAAKRGARALGVEFNPKMVELARARAEAAGVTERTEFRRADIFATDFSKATVVTMYLLPDLNIKLRPKLLEMRPGTRLVSHSFDMGEWKADQVEDVDGHGVYYWVVPAKVDGGWAMEHGGRTVDLALKQEFQKFEGAGITEPRLAGDRISFVMKDADGTPWSYSGRVRGRTMQGVAKASGKPDAKWSAKAA
jgi:SAM-dependent methyltransferase